MGILNKFSSVFKFKKEKITILVIGLNNSGKSTIINNLKNPNKRTTIVVPTIGFSNEKLSVNGAFLTAVDMSGDLRHRNLWEHNFKHCHGIVYVIDSSDKMRLVVVKDEIENILNHNDLKNRTIPILFVCNKIDCGNSISSIKIVTALGLNAIEKKPWHIISTNGISGQGLDEGVQWLVQHIHYLFANNDEFKTSRT